MIICLTDSRVTCDGSARRVVAVNGVLRVPYMGREYTVTRVRFISRHFKLIDRGFLSGHPIEVTYVFVLRARATRTTVVTIGVVCPSDRYYANVNVSDDITGLSASVQA